MNKYKSGFEEKVATALKRKRIKFGYETKKFKFIQPEKRRVYKPDFELLSTGAFVECKGKFTLADRQKMLWVKEQHPEMSITMLFQRARNPIRKGSKTTYADWCDANGVKWLDWDATGIQGLTTK